MSIPRYATRYLIEWAKRSHRSPLLIRGARQVGKTHLVESFARSHFSNLVTINFEDQPECISAFETLDPSSIIQTLQVQSGQKIDSSNTLLFLDEIQDCPNAIRAMRYFKEKMPQLAVVGAGSLLEFVLNEADFRMPVGRVEYLYLYPMCFKEYLQAAGEDFLVEWLESFDGSEIIPDVIHHKAHLLLKQYCLMGGMPEVVAFSLAEPDNVLGVQNMQSKLLQSYQRDFGKYAKTHLQHQHLQSVFRQLSCFVGKQVTYSKLLPDSTSQAAKVALGLLNLAGLCHYVTASSGAGVPLAANENRKKFKLNALDIGLYLRSMRLDAQLMEQSDLLLVNAGALMEQFVGQSLLSMQPVFESAELHFWARDAKGSSAEVDYVWQRADQIIPLEVKSNAAGHLKSMRAFIEKYQPPFGVKLSMAKYKWESPDILNVPLYLVSELDRLIKSCS